MGKIVEYLENGFADNQCFDRFYAQRHQRVFKTELAVASVVGGTVGYRQDLAGHAGILGNQVRQG